MVLIQSNIEIDIGSCIAVEERASTMSRRLKLHCMVKSDNRLRSSSIRMISG